MFKRKTLPIYLAASLFCATAFAQPLDLDYRVSGYESLRPKLVFNDGNDTFIQGDESLRAIGVPYERQGPYLVVKGIRERIVLEGKGMRKVSVIYTGSAVTPAMLTQQTEDPKARCDQAAVESRRVELMYGPINITPGPLLLKTLQQQAPEISRSAFTQIFIGSDGGQLAEKRANNIRDFLLKKNVPAAKFSVKAVDDPSAQAYMLIGNAVPCEPASKPTRAVNPAHIAESAVRGETTYAPPMKKMIGSGDVDTVLKMLSEGKISEETASTMIASINLSHRGTKLERLYAKNKVSDLQKEPAPVSEITVEAVAAKAPEPIKKPIIGQFTVENKTPLEVQSKGAVFPVENFAKKPSAKVMARLAGIVGEKHQSLFVVKGDGSPEAKSASSNAVKALLRLGVENVRFDRGASAGEIEILEEGEKK